MDDHLAITLLRHGVTDDNKRRAYIGWTDSPLSPSSMGELIRLKDELSEPELLFTSDLRRCVETANVLFSTPAENMTELREMHFGDWEGKTFDELQDDATYQQWVEQPFDIRPPNGESFATFSKRIETGWGRIRQTIAQTGSRHTVVVTHGGVIRYLLATYSPNKRDFWEWRIQHGHGYRLSWPSVVHLKEVSRCTSLQAVPIMGNVHG